MKDDNMTAESLLNENLEKEIHQEVSPGKYMSVDQLTAIEKLDKPFQAKIQSVIKRVSVAGELNTNEMKQKIAQIVGEHELPALRNHLMLSCINYLGEICRADSHLSFLNWLDAGGSIGFKTGKDEAITKALGTSGSIDDTAKAIKLIKSVFAQYRISAGNDSNFASFFKNAIASDLKIQIADSCWVYQDSPLEKWANLQNVKEGYANSSSPENLRLSKSRTRWDLLNTEQRLTEIALLLEHIFNLYSDCVLVPPVKTDKDPVSKIWRDISKSVEEYRINYLSNKLFNVLGQEGQQFKFNEVKCVFKDEEVYILDSDLRDKDRELWLRRMYEWLNGKVESGKAKGETIFVVSKNQALVIPEKTFAETLEDWVNSSIRFVINKRN